MRRRQPELAAPVAPVASEVRRLVAAELARQAATAAAADDASRRAAALAAATTGGPCAYCGTAGSVAYNGDEDGGWIGERPYWARSPFGPVCGDCQADRCPIGLIPIDDVSHRGYVAIQLLGLQRRWQPAQMGRRVAGVFRWWVEIEPRPPSPTTTTPRWSFVDRDALRAAIAPPPPPWRHGIACSRCGETDKWIYEPGSAEQIRDDAGWTTIEHVSVVACGGCRWVLPERRVRPGSYRLPSWLGPVGSSSHLRR